MPLSNTTPDAELIAACLEADKAAWDLLIQRYINLIYSVPRRYSLSEHDAADVAQNVCLTLYRKLDTLRDQTRLASWLLTTAQRESLALIKRRKRIVIDESDDGESLFEQAQATEPHTDTVLDQIEEEHQLRQALKQLNERCQRLLWHLYFDPSYPSYVDVAAKVNISSTAVGINRARCLERLRRLLEESEF